MRFRDYGDTIYDYYNYRIVECPSCQKPINLYSEKLVCIHCGYNKKYDVSGKSLKYCGIS